MNTESTTMTTLTTSITLGDPYSDGHGISKTFHFTLSGSNVSKELLHATFIKNLELTGVNPLDFFHGYEDPFMPRDAWLKIRNAGYNPEYWTHNTPNLEFVVRENPKFPDDSDEDHKFLPLLLWYFTNGTDITAEYLAYDDLLEGPLLASHIPGTGYGFYSPG